MRTDYYHFVCFLACLKVLLLGLVFFQLSHASPPLSQKLSEEVNLLIPGCMTAEGKLTSAIEPLKKYPGSGVAEFWREMGLYQTNGRGDERTCYDNRQCDIDKNKEVCVNYFKKQLSTDHFGDFSHHLTAYNKDRFNKAFQLGSALCAWLISTIRIDPERFKQEISDNGINFVEECDEKEYLFMQQLVMSEDIDDTRINDWIKHGEISLSDKKASANNGASFFMGGLSDVDIVGKLERIKNEIMDEEGLEVLADVLGKDDTALLDNYKGSYVPFSNIIGIYCAQAGEIMASNLGGRDDDSLGDVIAESAIRKNIKKYRDSVVNHAQVLGVFLSLRNLMVSGSETLGDFINKHLVNTEVQ
jgi:hypothetical protein